MKLKRTVMEEVRRHSVEEFPEECCGVIIGEGDSQRAIRIRNVQNEMHEQDPLRYPRTARTAYAGHPGDLRLALEAGEAPGACLLAFYHSHPDHDAYFSAEDIAQATPFGEPSYPDALQIVVSVYDHEVKRIKVFAWSPSGQTYGESELEEE
jgi:[CysO sulfur-carrier protein]-S-L-cysteine hydrolase